MLLDDGISSVKKKALRMGILMGAIGGLIVGYGVDRVWNHRDKPAAVTQQEASSLLARAGHGQLTLDRLLPNPAGALPNSVPAEVSIDGKKTVVWILRSGHRYAIVPGALFDGKGQDLTISVLRAENADHADRGDRESPSYTGFLWGQGKTAKVIFYEDPNCIFCHRQYQILKPLVNSGAITVEVVPVGFLKSSSAGKAAAEMKGGVSAFLQDEKGFDDAAEEGALDPLPMTPANVSYFAKQMDNTQYLGNTLEGGRIATPLLQIRTPNGWVDAEGLQSAQQIQDRIQGKS